MVLKGHVLSGDQGQIIVIQDSNPQGTDSFTDLYRAARHRNIPIETIVSLLDAAAGVTVIQAPAEEPTQAPAEEPTQAPAEEPIPTPTPTPAPKPTPKTTASKTPKKPTKEPVEEQEITANDLLESLKPVISFDRPLGESILAEFGAKKISDVAPGDYADLKAKLKEAVA